MKKKLIALFFAILYLSVISLTVSAEYETDIYVFYSKYCPHCHSLLTYLDNISGNYPMLKINALEVSEGNNGQIFSAVANAYGVNPSGVPITFIGESAITGYSGDSSTGKNLEGKIAVCIEHKCINPAVKAGILKEEDNTELINEIIELSKNHDVVKKFLQNHPDVEPSFEIDRDYIVSWQKDSAKVMVYFNSTTKEISKVLHDGLLTKEAQNNNNLTEKNENDNNTLKIIIWSVCAFLVIILIVFYKKKK